MCVVIWMCVMYYYHTSNSRECMGVNGEALQLHSVCTFYCKPCKNLYQYYKSHENPYQYYKSSENPYQVLQVTHAASERAMKPKVHMIKSECVHHNNTDGNKLAIFSGIASYYGKNI